MSAPRPRIGFVGIGSMGWPMARQLHLAGFEVTVYDATEARAGQFAQEVGGQGAATLAELARAADVVITMLPTSAIVEQVLTGEDGLLAHAKPGTLVLEMSSGVPTHTRRLAALAADKGLELVDAPVSGGVARAKTGELAIMFGGPAARLEALRPILDTVGSSVQHTGEVGSAHAMKALNNLVSAGGFLIGIEALLIGKRFGLDSALMVDVLNASTGMNNSTQKKFKQFVLSRRFDSGFGLDLMVKDLTIALGIGADTATPTPFAALCRELWASSAALLGKGEDHTAVAKLSEKLAGLELGES